MRAGYALTYDAPQIGVVHPGLFSTPTLGVFRVSLSQTPRFAPGSRGRHVRRSQQLDRRRRLRLPAARRAGLRLVADRRAAVQHLPGAGRLPAGPVPLLPPHVPARGAAQQLRDGVLRRIARRRAWCGARRSTRRRSARRRRADLARPFRAQFPQYRSIVEFTNDSKSWYDSVQLSFRQNAWHGINTQYNYTLVELHRLQLGQPRRGQRAGGQPIQSGGQRRAVQLRHPPQLQLRRQLRDPRRFDRRRTAADRHRLHRAVGPSVHARARARPTSRARSSA